MAVPLSRPMYFTDSERVAVIARLMERVEYDTNGGCWLWPGSSRRGYGEMRFGAEHLGVHRASFSVFKGGLPGGFVCHHCDVRQCFNPDHLFLGDPSTNRLDMIAKGRGPDSSGENSACAKLTLAQAMSVPERLKAMTTAGLAREYGVSQAAIYGIARGIRWNAAIAKATGAAK
jgi:hypothetical protein